MHFISFRSLSIVAFFSIIFFSCKKEKTLPAPIGLSITNISDTSCSISWTAVSGATGYKISIATDASFSRMINGYNDLSVATTGINVSTLTPYTNYYVRVVAYEGNTISSPINGNFRTNDAEGLVIFPWDNNALYAFNAKNGKVQWIFTATPFVATPVIQDSVVYIGGTDGRLYALNVADGTQKWKTSPTTNASIFTANPLIKNGVVYIGDYGGKCHAYNVSDGSTKWTYDIASPYRNINTTPVLNGNTVYFASYDGRIYALDAGTGAGKFATPSTGNPITSGMAFANGVIYVGALPKVYAFDATTGAIKWITPAPQFTQYSSSPTVVNNVVYIGGEDGIMYAFKTADGTILWSKVLGTGSIVSSPVYKNGNIYVGNGDGKMFALQSSTGNIVWQNNDAASTRNIYSGPTISERAIYSGTLEGKIIAMDINTGTTKWISSINGARFQASPCVITYKGDVYYPGLSGDIQ
jgi:outer membrane protein assembly factor BamB